MQEKITSWARDSTSCLGDTMSCALDNFFPACHFAGSVSFCKAASYNAVITRVKSQRIKTTKHSENAKYICYCLTASTLCCLKQSERTHSLTWLAPFCDYTWELGFGPSVYTVFRNIIVKRNTCIRLSNKSPKSLTFRNFAKIHPQLFE